MPQLVCNIGHLIRIGILQFYGEYRGRPLMNVRLWPKADIRTEFRMVVLNVRFGEKSGRSAHLRDLVEKQFLASFGEIRTLSVEPYECTES